MYLAALLEEIRGLREDLAPSEVGVEAQLQAAPVDLTALTVPELRELAGERGIDVSAKIRKDDLIALLEAEAE